MRRRRFIVDITTHDKYDKESYKMLASILEARIRGVTILRSAQEEVFLPDSAKVVRVPNRVRKDQLSDKTPH